MKSILPIILLFLANLGFSQGTNVELVSHVRMPETSNDIWGYEKDGVEYAVIGTRNATRIYSLADPAAPVEVAVIDGAASTWRDMKHWGDYIFVVADQGRDGLLTIDMTNAPDSVSHSFWKPTMTPDNQIQTLEKCHNLYVDDQGYGYLSGCNVGAGGVILLDLKPNPLEPEILGFANITYSHDVYVQGDRMYTSEIFRGQAGIYDISDRSNPTVLATQVTSFDFTHNIWVSDDGNYMFTTDERGNATVDAFDISDLDNIMPLDRFKPLASKDKGVIPHNTHYLDGYLYTSYYTDGVIITDVNKPDNMIQVGQYDTFSGGDGGFNGNWGAYPFLSSGLLLASDINTGLYVLQPNIQRACYLEGRVVNQESGSAIPNVKVEILSDDISEANTEANGMYKSGQATAGEFQVVFSHPEYINDTLTVELQHGEVTIIDAGLKRKRRVSFNAVIVGTEGDIDPNNGMIVLQNDDFTYSLMSDENGMFSDSITEGVYNIYGGKWGYKQYADEGVQLDNDMRIEIMLEPGYEDDFIFDFGWVESGNASTGKWERGVPVGTFLSDGTPSNPDTDIAEDIGNLCYVTGNRGGGVGDDDIDNGSTILTSPAFDISSYETPVLNYSVWFLNAGGDSPNNDSLMVNISNGTDTVLVETFIDRTGDGSLWIFSEIFIKDFIEVTPNMNLIVSTADSGAGHIVEAGFDGFSILDDAINPTDNIAFSQVGAVFPNPFKDVIQITLQENLVNTTDIWDLQLYSLTGQLMERQRSSATGENLVMPTQVKAGVYILTMTNVDKNISSTTKVVKF